MEPRTLFEKIWRNHVILEQPSGEALLYVDRNLLQQGGSFLACDRMRIDGRAVPSCTTYASMREVARGPDAC